MMMPMSFARARSALSLLVVAALRARSARSSSAAGPSGPAAIRRSTSSRRSWRAGRSCSRRIRPTRRSLAGQGRQAPGRHEVRREPDDGEPDDRLRRRYRQAGGQGPRRRGLLRGADLDGDHGRPVGRPLGSRLRLRRNQQRPYAAPLDDDALPLRAAALLRAEEVALSEAPADLDGKKIGVCDSCTVEFYLRGALKIPGLSLKVDVKKPKIVVYARRCRVCAISIAARSTPTSRPRPWAWRGSTRARSSARCRARRSRCT